MILRGTWVAVLVWGACALAQNPVPPGVGPSGSPNRNANPGGANPNSGGNSPGGPNSNSVSNGAARIPRIDLPGGARRSGDAISGRVILGDGGEPGANVAVQRVCGEMCRHWPVGEST